MTVSSLDLHKVNPGSILKLGEYTYMVLRFTDEGISVLGPFITLNNEIMNKQGTLTVRDLTSDWDGIKFNLEYE